MSTTEVRGRSGSRRTLTTRLATPARGALLPLVLLLLTTMPACARTATSAAPPAPSASVATGESGQDRFLQLYRGYQADYEPAKTVANLAEMSEVVAVGRLKEIREGRIQGVARDDPGRSEYLIYVFDVIEKVKGTVPGDVVYVEAIKPNREPAASFDAAAPKGAEALLYLRSASALAPAEPSLGPDVPAGTRLQWFTTPQGFLIHLGGRVLAPLDQIGQSRPIFQGGDPDPTRLRSWLPSP